MLYETIAISLFGRLLTSTLLVARSIATGTSCSQSELYDYWFCILSHGFLRKDRLLAVCGIQCVARILLMSTSRFQTCILLRLSLIFKGLIFMYILMPFLKVTVFKLTQMFQINHFMSGFMEMVLKN